MSFMVGMCSFFRKVRECWQEFLFAVGFLALFVLSLFHPIAGVVVTGLVAVFFGYIFYITWKEA